LKVAVTNVPLTTFCELLALVATFVAWSLGLVDASAGLVSMPSDVLAIMLLLAPFCAEAFSPEPPPHPATKVASSNAINHISGLNKLFNRFIFVFLSLKPAINGWVADALRQRPLMLCPGFTVDVLHGNGPPQSGLHVANNSDEEPVLGLAGPGERHVGDNHAGGVFCHYWVLLMPQKVTPVLQVRRKIPYGCRVVRSS
jgi:hypothetical protein